jgi:argininosuccinate lyase
MTAKPEAGLDTGRLSTPLHPQAHRIVYAAHLSERLVDELRAMSQVDRAHLVMLAERRIVDGSRAARLLTEIGQLSEENFAAVWDRPIPRGVYLSYEGLLTERLGERVAGILHTGRSRNDLNATTVKLRTRETYLALLHEVDGLVETLLDRALLYRQVTMPAYTHGQPAVPITYGHYLAGLALSVMRGHEDLLSVIPELGASPLGAGAVGGTSIPIDPARTAELLGFACVMPNSVDAVASRDFVLRLLAHVSVLGVTLARAARDFSTWTTEEFGLLRMADDLVGSSSMMPQKRNPFLLEHICGKATQSLGGFMSAASAMVTAGYTNAIAVGTEAAAHLWPGLRAGTDAVTLLRLVVAGSEPDEQRMRERCLTGFTAATYQAERLVAAGVPFRTAHYQIGREVLARLQSGHPATVTERDCLGVDPADVVAACAYGGGPGGGTVDRTVGLLRDQFGTRRDAVNELRNRWKSADSQLDSAVRQIIDQARDLGLGERQSNPQESP